VLLRQRNIKKNPENNRYEWASIKAFLKAAKFDDVEEAKEALSESRKARLDELKERVGADRPKKKGSAKKSKKAAKKAADEDDDEDED